MKRMLVCLVFLAVALARPATAAKRNAFIAGPAMVARDDMDENVVCAPSETLINRGFVEQPCTYFFPLSDSDLKGQFVSITLFALDQNAVADIEARVVRKLWATEDAFDSPDTVMEAESEDEDPELRKYEGLPPSDLKKIETNKYFYYVEVLIPDLNLGVVGVQVRWDDKAK